MPGTSGSRGHYDTKAHRVWGRLILTRDPWCRGPCGGYNRSAVADHIVPVKDGGDPLDLENGQGLCRACHALKSRREQGARGELAGGRNVRQRSALVAGYDPITGIPLDPRHEWNRDK